MVKKIAVALLFALPFAATDAIASTNPLGLPQKCYKNDECVIKALEHSANNEMWSGADPFTGMSYIADSNFWHYQRSHNTRLWHSVIKVCPTLNGGRYPIAPHTDMLVVGCQEAEFGK